MAVVNPVNCVGVMGAGLAQQIKSKYPQCFSAYRRACLARKVKVGLMHVWADAGRENGPRMVINFPTKVHWKDDSKLEYVQLGLKALRASLVNHSIVSVAIPKLGCGLGKLDWNIVRSMIIQYLDDLPDVEIFVYG